MSKVNFDFSGENYIVTGASSGMGRQIAEDLIAAGANVLAIGRNHERLCELKNSHTNMMVAALDVCDYEALEKAIDEFVKKVGKIDGIVYAAGIAGLTPLRAYDENLAKQMMDISFWAGTKLVQYCSKKKVSNDNSSFVLFSSVSATHTDKGIFAYAASKAALQTAVRSFAKENAPRGIRINTISPGWVQTSMTKDLGELHNLNEVNTNSVLGIGQPTDVSSVVLFLLSDAAKWITGTNVVVDGGYLA